MNSYPNSSTSMTAEQEKLLSYCLYFGFNSNSAAEPSNDQCDQFIATQAMVWVIVGNLFGTGSDDSAARKLCDTAPNPAASYGYYAGLKNNISASYYARGIPELKVCTGACCKCSRSIAKQFCKDRKQG